MSERRESIHGQWSSRWAFVLAATGSAVGLGNIWKFPYITGEHGGGAFVLVYLCCIAMVGVPIMVAEVMLGRRGRRSPINTMYHLCREEGSSHHWEYLGWAGVAAGFMILSYYSVIAGWALAYVARAAGGAFHGLGADGVATLFNDLVSSPERLLAWHTIFMVMTMVVVARGVRSGLEKAVRFLMPALFMLLFGLVFYAMSTGHFNEGLAFLFEPDFSKLDGKALMVAMGHAFFTLSLGMGAIMVYGSYLPRNTSIARTSITIALADTLVALMAGMAIFPIVFANGLEPGAGPGLIFQTLPIAFGQMPWGGLIGTMFFVLVVFAAWTSAISLIEPLVAWMVENHGMSRIRATLISGIGSWLLGLLTVFSFNIWSDVHLLSFVDKFKDSTIFDLLDFLTANIMLPFGGVAIAVFAGWSMSRRSSMEELHAKEGIAYRSWLFLVRFVAPIAVVMVFLNLIGVIEFG